MSKERISTTIDEEVAQFVQRDDVNTSGLVNKLLKQHMSGDTGREQMLQLRIDQVEEDVRSMEGQLENKREELERLRSELAEIEEETDDVLDEAAEALDYTDLRDRNRKVEYWMDQAGLSFDELESEMKDRWSK